MRRTVTCLAAPLMALANVAIAQTATSSVAPYIAPAFPEDLVSAKRVDRVAWLAYDQGRRNVYTAAAPGFKPVKLTNFTEDDGVVLSDLEISDDGSTVTFLRGSQKLAVATIGRDMASLEAERALEGVTASASASASAAGS